MKSTTAPRAMRSMTLPTAPPITIAIANANSFCAGLRRSRYTMNAEAASARPMKNQRCQPPASASSDQAMPVFSSRTRSKKPVTRRLSPSRKSPTTRALVN
jgi:hypothetical protein